MILFLNREGRTKSHPLARKASSPLRSGSRRNDVSLIIIVGAETRNPPPDTATGAATDTATTDGPACPAAKQPLKGEASNARPHFITAQISRFPKSGKTTSRKLRNIQHVCDFMQNVVWKSPTKSISSKLHLQTPAPKAVTCAPVIQQCICVKKCSLVEEEPWYRTVL